MSLRIEKTLDLGRLKTNAAAALPAAVEMGMQHIKEVAVELTPLEEGTLRRSAKVAVKVEGTNVVASIHYDGPYARYQHEKMNLRHEVGQAKFLETALFTEADRALKIISNQLGRAL